MASTNESIKVSLSELSAGENLINVNLMPGQSAVMQLTPLQARALAMDLIKAVHQADVRASLQRNENLRRDESELQTAGQKPVLVRAWG